MNLRLISIFIERDVFAKETCENHVDTIQLHLTRGCASLCFPVHMQPDTIQT